MNVFSTIFTHSLLTLILDRTLRDSFTTKTDNAIQQLTDAFTDLKGRFRDRMNLDSWKIASTMKDGVLQLAATTNRLTEIGELQVNIVLSYSPHFTKFS